MEADTVLCDRTKRPEHVEDEAEDQGDAEAEAGAYDNNLHKNPRNPGSTGTETPRELVMEALGFHNRYEFLFYVLDDDSDSDERRDGCLELLANQRIPLWTRVLTLHLFAAMSPPVFAEESLQKAERILETLDWKGLWQILFLKNDNDRMLRAMESWRRKKGLVGQDLDGTDWAGINWIDIDDQQAEDLINERERTCNPGTPSPLVLADGFSMMGLFERPETREFFLGL